MYSEEMEACSNFRLLTSSALLLVVITGAQGSMTQVPKNSAVLMGKSIVFTCCSDGQETLFWKHKQVRSTTTKDIFDLNGLVNGFLTCGRFSVTRDSRLGCHHLKITNVQRNDSGTFNCVDNEGLGQPAGWELAVLESFQCQETNRKAEYMGVNEFGLPQDVISMVCIYKYFGNVSPKPKCEWSSGAQLLDNYHRVTEANCTITLSIQLPATKQLNGNQLSCYTNTEDESTANQYPTTWKSTKFTIDYALFRQKGVSQCNREELSLDCQPQCNYNMGQFSNGSSYCEIIYPSRSRTHQNVYVLLPENTMPTEKPHPPTPQRLLSEKGIFILTSITGVLGIGLLAVIGVLIFKCIKGRSRADAENGFVHVPNSPSLGRTPLTEKKNNYDYGQLLQPE